MKIWAIVAVLLIVGGILGLVYEQFSYTKETHEGNIGPIEFSISEKEQVKVPMWLSIGAIVGGGALFLVALKKA